MLIVKKYQDYYDSAIGFGGVDTTCVWERIPHQEANNSELAKISKMLEGAKIGWNVGPYWHDSRQYRYTTKQPNFPEVILPFIIGFCGKTYVGYMFQWPMNRFGEHKIKIVYGWESFAELHNFDLQKRRARDFNEKNDKIRTQAFFERFHDQPHPELFFRYHVPIWVYDLGTNLVSYKIDQPNKKFNYSRPYFMTNPPLGDYEFYRVFSAAQTFQEIQMYIQGVLGNKEKEIVEISEKNKLQQHGFDPKWSFRNPCPPNRKKGNCKL